MYKLIIGICIGLAMAAVAWQFDAFQKHKAAREIPLSAVKTDGFHRIAPSGVGGMIGHPPFAPDAQTYDAVELKKALHDSVKTKAADGNEAGDW